MLDSVDEVLHDLSSGKLAILTDDENRENEGDLICFASKATPANVNFMITHGRGILCVPLSDRVAARLDLQIPQGKHDPRGTAFSQSLDVIQGTTTGVSAYDRARTIAAISDPQSTLDDFYSPGHVFPLLARSGGVLERPGHTEGVIDLVRLAHQGDVGVLCEILNPDGTMARLPQLLEMRERFSLKICSIEQLIDYHQSHSGKME